ncbi:hypothetical protein VPHF99_0136 [Vibrio phage F99]|nr:hypothetical protein MYOV085v1_p0013 [Vibrio phage 355E48.1]
MWNLAVVVTHPIIAYLTYLLYGNSTAALIGLSAGLTCWILLKK